MKDKGIYIEIVNGLFRSVPDEEFPFLEGNEGLYAQIKNSAAINIDTNITMEYLREAVSYVFGTPFREGNSVRQEEPTTRAVVDMNEQELIEYFDRISQEEEN